MAAVLLANTGIQFIRIPVNLTQQTEVYNRSRFSYAERAYINNNDQRDHDFIIAHRRENDEFIVKASTNYDGLYLNDEAVNPATWEVINESAIRSDRLEPLEEEEVITLRLQQALDLYENEWLPLPYFKERDAGRDVHDWPTAWGRMILQKLSSTHPQYGLYSHILVLAFDTNIYEQTSEKLTPTLLDATNRSLFRCAADDRNIASFLTVNGWAADWLDGIWKRRGLTAPRASLYYNTGCYFCLLKALGTIKDPEPVFVPIEFTNADRTIEVDLVLDVGNSRTCGLVIETDIPGRDGVALADAIKLEIQDLGAPENSYNEPFDMRIAFANCFFGMENAGQLAGNRNLFSWPSLVRIGKEAERYVIINADTNSTNSSPKKYLWDLRPQAESWQAILPYQSTGQNTTKLALGGISVSFNDDGVLRERAQQAPGTSTRPYALTTQNGHFSRSSLMTFALAEIILQALTFINSTGFRRKRGNERLRRTLNRIVLTCPTAMLDKEKLLMREHATDAVAALKNYYRDQPDFVGKTDLQVIPSLNDLNSNRDANQRKNWGFDEATCSQLVFLYGEICGKFKNRQAKFFDLFGKAQTNKTSLTVASVDIGGGTTDLMICEYVNDQQANNPVLTPNPLFWEGFNRAGDAIVKSVIERLVLPAIRIYAGEQGGTDLNLAEAMRFLFGPDIGGGGPQANRDRLLRKQFANQIALPIALGVLQFATQNRDEVATKHFRDFFSDVQFPHNEVINHVNRRFSESGSVNFDIRNLSITLSPVIINQIISDVMERMLRSLCLVISQYNCDFVLLSGRPTMMPIIRELFVTYLPVTPDRIISLGNYRIGNWYPFADAFDMIKDPKTTVVVGAAIALLSGTLGRLPEFRLDTSLLKTNFNSTVDYIGRIDIAGRNLSARNVYFGPNDQLQKVMFNGPLMLGFRQFSDENWIATPMYKLDFASNDARQKYNNRLPLSITIQRGDLNSTSDKETLLIEEAMDKEGNPVRRDDLLLRLQTLVDDEGHWLDTGIFSLNNLPIHV